MGRKLRNRTTKFRGKFLLKRMSVLQEAKSRFFRFWCFQIAITFELWKEISFNFLWWEKLGTILISLFSFLVSFFSFFLQFLMILPTYPLGRTHTNVNIMVSISKLRISRILLSSFIACDKTHVGTGNAASVFTKTSSVFALQFLMSLPVLHQTCPCLGSAAKQRRFTSETCSGVPCWSSNLKKYAQASPESERKEIWVFHQPI